MSREDSVLMSHLAECANRVAEFLALNDFDESPLSPVAMQTHFGRSHCDVVLLCGNSVLATAEASFSAVRDQIAQRVLIAGGIGHSTPDLYQAVRSHPRYRIIEADGLSEAEVLAKIAVHFWGLDPQEIILESASRNCGENARFALRLIQEQNVPAESIVIVQDPTMQRRMDATVRKVWRDQRVSASFANFSVFTPRLTVENGSFVFAEPGLANWGLNRFLSLLLGEVHRLREYGPRGRNFIVEVAVPAEVIQGHADLARAFPDLVRTVA